MTTRNPKKSDARGAPRSKNRHPGSFFNDTINRYTEGKVSPAEAQSILEVAGSLGALLAGEISLERASNTGDFDEATHHYSRAVVLFNKVVETPDSLSSRGDREREKARARLLAAAVPVHALIHLQGSLPPLRPLAVRVYNRTIEAGQQALEVFDKLPQNEEMQRKRLAGTLAEIAILLLPERHAVIEGISERYWPVLSTISDDRANTLDSTEEHSWDVGIYTKTGPIGTEYPDLTSRIQVKFRHDQYDKLADTEGIRTLYVSDLRLFEQQTHVGIDIVRDVIAEHSGGQDADLTARLDQQTDMFQAAIA